MNTSIPSPSTLLAISPSSWKLAPAVLSFASTFTIGVAAVKVTPSFDQIAVAAAHRFFQVTPVGDLSPSLALKNTGWIVTALAKPGAAHAVSLFLSRASAATVARLPAARWSLSTAARGSSYPAPGRAGAAVAQEASRRCRRDCIGASSRGAASLPSGQIQLIVSAATSARTSTPSSDAVDHEDHRRVVAEVAQQERDRGVADDEGRERRDRGRRRAAACSPSPMLRSSNRPESTTAGTESRNE